MLNVDYSQIQSVSNPGIFSANEVRMIIFIPYEGSLFTIYLCVYLHFSEFW